MKGDTEVLLMIAFFCLGAVLGNTIQLDGLPDWVGSIVESLATLAAAFFGAKFAFQFQAEKDKLDRDKRDVTYSNQATISIIEAYNIVELIHRTIIVPRREDEHFYFAIPPIAYAPIKPLSIDFASLSFLIESENPNIIMDLMHMQLAYNGFLDVVKQRSDLHHEKFQPALERATAKAPRPLTRNEIEQAVGIELGERDLVLLKKLTQYLIESVERALPLLERNAKELNRATGKLYPVLKVVSMGWNTQVPPQMPN